MFNLDFKPSFYSYPLTSQQFARVQAREKQIHLEMRQLSQDIEDTARSDNHENFAHYIEHQREKYNILKEELKEYQQITDCHERIDNDLKKRKEERSQVKNKMLEYYQNEISVEKSRRSREKSQELEKDREHIQSNVSVLSSVKNEIKRTFHMQNRKSEHLHFQKIGHPGLNLGKYHDNFGTASMGLPRVNPESHSVKKRSLHVKLPIISKQRQLLQTETPKHQIPNLSDLIINCNGKKRIMPKRQNNLRLL